MDIEIQQMLVGHLSSGHVIFLDPDRVGIAQGVCEHLSNILKFIRVDPQERFQIITFSTQGVLIGGATCVPTGHPDRQNIFYARPFAGRGAVSDRYMRYVKNRIPEPTDHVTMVLKRGVYQGGDGFDVVQAYFGKPAPFNPLDPKCPVDQLAASVRFWLTHALIDDGRGYDQTTKSIHCPWLEMGRKLIVSFDEIFHG